MISDRHAQANQRLDVWLHFLKVRLVLLNMSQFLFRNVEDHPDHATFLIFSFCQECANVEINSSILSAYYPTMFRQEAWHRILCTW